MLRAHGDMTRLRRRAALSLRLRVGRNGSLLPLSYEVKSAKYSDVGVTPVSSRCSRARVQAT